MLPQKDMLSQADIAELFGVSLQTVSRWWRTGEIPPPIRVGRRLLRWRRADFEKWSKKHEPAQAGK
jgi:excisionase family DNA binding protein